MVLVDNVQRAFVVKRGDPQKRFTFTFGPNPYHELRLAVCQQFGVPLDLLGSIECEFQSWGARIRIKDDEGMQYAVEDTIFVTLPDGI